MANSHEMPGDTPSDIQPNIFDPENNAKPNPEQFGEFLATTEMDEESREAIVNEWLDAFRSNLDMTHKDLGKELGVTGQRIQALKTSLVGSTESRHLNWDTVEKIRHYYEHPEERDRKPKPRSDNNMNALAREFGNSPASVTQYVDRLVIEDRYNLTPDEMDSIRKYHSEITEHGRHLNPNSLARLAEEEGTSRSAIHATASILGIDPNNATPEDLNKIREYRKNSTRINKKKK